jgi:hypothetical protein
MLKKLAAMLMGTIMAFMPLAGSALADYTLADFPAPFVEDNQANFLIIVGSGGTASGIAQDLAGLINVAARLGGETVTTEGTGTEVSVSGEAATLSSGINKIYLANALNAQVSTVTVDSLPTILADGTFIDENSVEYDYEQTITVGSRTFTFSNSNNDLDDPALIVDIGTSVTAPLYILKINFEKAVDFDATTSEGEPISIFGKDYTVGTGSDADELQLLGGAESIFLDTEDGSVSTVTVSGTEYTVTLKGVTSGDTPKAVIQVETGGVTDTDTVTQGQTKEIGGIDVYVKTANYYGLESKLGDATIMLGADEIWLQDGQPVMTGSSKTDIDGTVVDFDNDPGSGNTTYAYINVTAEDSDLDHLVTGEAFVDPVFGTLKLHFADAPNAPIFSADKGEDENTARSTIDLKRASDDCVAVEMTIQGDSATIEFANGASLANDDGESIHVVEGVNMAKGEFFILNSGSYQHFMEIKKATCDDDSTADDDVTLEDLFSGTSYKITDKNLGATAYDWVIKGQTYKLYCTASNTIKMTSSDYSLGGTGNVAVYPYLKPLAAANYRIAFTDSVTVVNATVGTLFQLPTTTLNLTSNSTLSAETGTVDYNYTVTAVTSTIANVTLAIDVDQDATNDNGETNAGILFMEEKDLSDLGNYHAVIIPTSNPSASYYDVDRDNIEFTHGSTVTAQLFDDTDFIGYIDPFGAYVIFDKSDTYQEWATLSYPVAGQMYADVYISEIASEASGGTTSVVGRSGVIKSNIAVVDTDVTSTQKSNYHLILGGGPAVNKLSAEALGLDFPTYGTDTGIPEDGYMINLIEDAFVEGMYGLVIAGWDAEDTAAAMSMVQANMADTTGMVYYYPAAPAEEEEETEETEE